MRCSTRRPRDWQIIQQARAEFVINRLRENLPASSLWHEKRFAKAQLESLVIVSNGGVYDVDTFDATGDSFLPIDDLTILNDLAIRVLHIARSHKTLDEQSVHQIMLGANSEFEAILADDRDSVSSSFSRVTCTVDFDSPTDDVEHNGELLLGAVANKLGCQLNYVPYVTREIWLSDSDFYNLKEVPEYARRAGEFVFDEPLPVDEVTQWIQSAVHSTCSLRAPGIHGTISDMGNVHDLHFVGRRY